MWVRFSDLSKELLKWKPIECVATTRRIRLALCPRNEPNPISECVERYRAPSMINRTPAPAPMSVCQVPYCALESENRNADPTETEA